MFFNHHKLPIHSAQYNRTSCVVKGLKKFFANWAKGTAGKLAIYCPKDHIVGVVRPCTRVRTEVRAPWGCRCLCQYAILAPRFHPKCHRNKDLLNKVSRTRKSYRSPRRWTSSRMLTHPPLALSAAKCLCERPPPLFVGPTRSETPLRYEDRSRCVGSLVSRSRIIAKNLRRPARPACPKS